MLDERQYRDDQPCGDQLFIPCAEAESEPRKFLGPAQLEWLKRGLRNSGASLAADRQPADDHGARPAQGAPINKDSWDGYGQSSGASCMGTSRQPDPAT